MSQVKTYEKEKIHWIFIPIIIIFGILIRLVFFPYQIPITLDGLDYFLYAADLSKGNIFPNGYLINKFGWGLFLAPIFYIFQNSEFIDLMNAQRMASILISCMTFIPIYLTIRKFFSAKIAIVGASLFIFNPKIIENSLLGMGDPLFIFLIFSTIWMGISNKSKNFIISFFVGGLSFVVRPEGILVILPLLTALLFKNLSKKRILKHILIGIVIFGGTIYVSDSIITYQNSKISIFDTIYNFKNISNEQIVYENGKVGDISNNFEIFLQNSFSKFFIYSIWILIPNCIFFITLGLIKTRIRITRNKILFLLIYFELSLTALFAYGKNIEETRYLFTLFLPILIFSSYGTKLLFEKFRNKNLHIILILFIIISSGFFMFYTMDDYNYQREISFVTNIIILEADGVNLFEDTKFLKSSQLIKTWPKLPPIKENLKVDYIIKRFVPSDEKEISEFIEKNHKKGLTHILVKEKNGDPFFEDLLENYSNYPYLNKIFDYREHDFKNKILVFEILPKT